MIKSFRDRDAERLFHREDGDAYDVEIVDYH